MTARHAQVRILGVTADITYRLDEDEHARRQTAGTPRLTNPHGTLDELMDYPECLPVPVDARNKGQRALITRGLLERDGDTVVRRIRPPLTIDLALVPARGWRSGLNHASRFAPFCNRAMLLPKAPRDPGTLIEVGFWGVGIYTAGAGGELVEHVAPEPFVKRRHTPAAWWFVEQVYRQVAEVLAAARAGGGSGV